MTPEQAAALRKPFDPKTIGKLPKANITLDFVGHAAVTDRLIAVDPSWTWEPLAVGEDGLPAYDRSGGLWIRLTVCGVTRLGYGDGPDPKQRIGDAIRNCAMRFGVALDLWSRQELEGVDPNGGGAAAKTHSVEHYNNKYPPSPQAETSAPPISTSFPGGVDDPPAAPPSAASPDVDVEALRGKVNEALTLDRTSAIIELGRLKVEAAKLHALNMMTTLKGEPVTVNILVDEALKAATKLPKVAS